MVNDLLPHTSSSMLRLLAFIFISLTIAGCKSDQPNQPNGEEQSPTTSHVQESENHGCVKCHPMQLDDNHNLLCTSCHGGNNRSDDKIIGHQELISQPAHPDHMMKSCGNCHEKQVHGLQGSLHMTLRDSINMVRAALGAEDDLDNLTEIPISIHPKNLVELGDDLLRRQCLRCHLYSKGDDYAGVQHATGCGSCHLNFSENSTSHLFIRKPSDSMCLRCHYGNKVGFDYYGRFEHDLNNEYRTPFDADTDQANKYGIPYHNLSPDIHFLKGLVCIDCHSGASLMYPKSDNNSISCRSCHDREELGKGLVDGVVQQNDIYVFNSKGDHSAHAIPLMKDPAHNQYKEQIDCQVCHALWSFNDQPTHLLRNDVDDYEQFYHLLSQGNSEVANLLTISMDFNKDYPLPFTSDKITGEKRLGVWYKGFGSRRWEPIILGRDGNGTIRVMRPMLDLYLSWLDEDEAIRFDSEPTLATAKKLTPYTPHTTGKAGLFYSERIRNFLQLEKERNDSAKSHRTEKK